MVLWSGENLSQMIAFTMGSFRVRESAQVYDSTHDTWVNVSVGDRVAAGTRGEFYPIAPEPLADSYEKVS